MTTDVPSTEERIVLVHVCMTEENVVVDTTLIIQEGFTRRLTIKGWSIAPHTLTDIPTSLTSAGPVKNMITFINSRPICCGNPDETFLPLLIARKGNFMDGSGMFGAC